MKPTLGFIGIGAVGGPIAAKLLQQDYPLRVGEGNAAAARRRTP